MEKFQNVDIQQLLKDYGFDVGYGFFLGWVVGFAIKKFFKIFAFVLGVYIVTLIWLHHAGFGVGFKMG